MNKEQIEELRKALTAMSKAISETETMISDYNGCQSEISRKYLAAAIKKQVSGITAHVQPGMFDPPQS